jgi:N-acetylmuramoyl-L-alanine amidase
MRTLFIDLGHSSRFSGANGVKSEVMWNRSIWFHLRSLIDGAKWNIVLVPESYKTDFLGSNYNLVQRIKFINKNCHDGDWVLSIHGNAAANLHARGVTTCYMGGSGFMKKKAISLSLAFSRTTGIPLFGDGSFDDRTGRFGRIGMVRDTKPPALLIEAGFVSNAQDMAVDPKTAASAIANWLNSGVI